MADEVVLDGLIRRLEDEGWYGPAKVLARGGTVEDALLASDVAGVEAFDAVSRLVERWQRNRRQSERLARQRKRAAKTIAERTGERDRARRDRATLADWIDRNVPGVQVQRVSGRYTIEASTIKGEP